LNPTGNEIVLTYQRLLREQKNYASHHETRRHGEKARDNKDDFIPPYVVYQYT